MGLIVWLSAFLAVPASAQLVPAFELETVTVRDDAGGVRVDLYTKIPYAHLQFIKRGTEFLAEYEVLAEVHRLDDQGRKRGIVLSRIYDRRVPAVQSYAATQADSLYDVAVHSEADLPPGRYALEVTVEDRVASTTFVQKAMLDIRDLTVPLALSDILIAESYDPATRRFTPSVGNVVNSDAQAFSLYYEVYARQAQQARIVYRFLRTDGRERLPSWRDMFRDRPERDDRDIAFEKDEGLQVRAGTNQATLRVPVGNFEVGDYLVRVELQNAAGQVVDAAEKPLSIRWMGLNDQIRNLDRAIAQLRYIAKKKDLNYIKEAETDTEKAKRFQAFWDRRDPTPGTERNERMEEYYYRVSYADEEYGRFGKGWLTDRGEVYILYGRPDHVDYHPYSFGDSESYEVWEYYRAGRRFIFVDRSGVGDFELLIPIWDERTRLR
ncbi:MAG: GWxTD domain-containing protein [Bacteroidota bacterium]